MSILPSCFNNLIGLRGICGLPPPNSGLYFDDLESINLLSVSKLANPAFPKGADWILQKYEFACRLFMDEVLGEILQHLGYRWNTEQHHLISGFWQNNYLPAPPLSPLGRGIRIENRLIANAHRVKIHKIKVRTMNANPNAVLEIADGSQIINVNIPLQPDVPTEIIVNHVLQSSVGYVRWVMDDFMLNASTLQLQPVCNLQFLQQMGCELGAGEGKLNIQGWDGTTITDVSSFGIQVELIISCDENELFCALSHRMAPLLLYRTGIEIVKERLASERVNAQTLDMPANMRLLQDWQNIYDHKLSYFIHQLALFFQNYDCTCLSCVHHPTLWWQP